MAATRTIAHQIALRWRNRPVLGPVSFVLEPGEHLLITGDPGSGKTLLSKAFTKELFHEGTLHFESEGKPASPRIVRVEQHYHFNNRSNVNNFYYQQRFNSIDADDAATIREELEKTGDAAEKWLPLLRLFSMEQHLDAPLLHLSSGEHKRFQLIRAFLQAPDIMILDEPFTGMDTRSRQLLTQLIEERAAGGMQFVLICDPAQAPACFHKTLQLDSRFQIPDNGRIELPENLLPVNHPFTHLVLMKDAAIRYQEQPLLADINWTILPGEAWWLKGVNGSGKSTLISLINGDNPKAYANNLVLFDRVRGSGETIWDIKKNIGYVSPELQWYFDRNSTVFQAVASGLFDSIGLFRSLTTEQEKTVRQWLHTFHLTTDADIPIWQLSTSQQRLALLARAMVKNPVLLILDEPCQGLSDRQQKAFTSAVNHLCEDPGRSLIYVTHYEHELPDCIRHKMELQNGHAITSSYQPAKALSA
ncbi:MAG: ATP-binding cassette domain-containing protein [Bacteroidetes bacterium]|nr:ATP-binding cassette domain-containing protein [Bacteroidota bacterium]